MKNTSIIKLVGMSSSYNSNDLGCPCEVTLWVTLQSRPCLHSGLLMPTLVDELNLSEVSFNKVYWFRMKNWLCAFLIVKRNLCWFTTKILLLNKAFFINIFFINNRMKIMKMMKKNEEFFKYNISV